jgi:signal transduction histidine kinase/ligand-binding sensor domain-containing protein/ActR/RegA family two-component response regulator
LLKELKYGILQILIFFAFATNGQSFYTEFEYLSTKDGLPQNHVFSIQQDRDGFIWFCTMDGLSKYDGFNFTNYHHNPTDSSSISSSYIDRFFQDSKGRCWVTTHNGFNAMDRKTGRFKSFFHYPDDEKSIGHHSTRDIKEDDEGYLWIVHGKGVDRLDPETHVFTHYFHEDFEVGRYSGDICIDRNKNIWVLGLHGLFKVNIAGHSLEYIGEPDVDTDVVLEGRQIYQDSRGTIWVAFNRGLYTFDPQSNQFTPAENFLQSTNIVDMTEYPNGIMVIGTFGYGMMVYHLDERRILNSFGYDSNNPKGISGSTVYSLLVDSFDNLWLGLFHGVNRMNPDHSRFKLLQNETGINNLKNYTVSVYGDPYGGLWSNTMEGLFYRENIFSPYVNLLGNANFATGYHDVRGIAGLSAKNTLINIRGSGLFHYDHDSDFLHQLGDPEFLKNDAVCKIISDKHKDGRIWLSGVNGLGSLDFPGMDTTWYPIPPFQNNNQSKIFCYLDQSDAGDIYFVANNKLIRFDPQSKTMTLANKDFEFTGGVSSIICHQDKVWISTTSGIFVHDIQTRHITEIKDKKGLSISSSGLQIDSKGNAWSIVNNDIRRIESNGTEIQKYKSPIGFVYGIGTRMSKDILVFGGDDGMLFINPDYYFKDSLAPKILFAGIEMAHKTIDFSKENEYVEEIHLDFKDKVFTLHYTALHFINRTHIQYRYMLEGFENSWVDAGTRRSVSYTNLKPGKYTFRAEAITEDGITSEQPLQISIFIKPPYYMSTWFFLLMGLIMGAVIWFFYNARKKAFDAIKEKDLAEKNAKYKDMFLANISHEIRTPMNAIIGLNNLLLDSELDSKQRQFVEAIKSSGENLLWIVNDILDQAKIESGKYKIVHAPFDLHITLEKLKTLFSYRAGEKNIHFSISVSDDLPDIVISDQVRIFQILSNLLNNALKFTEKGQISLRVLSNYLDDHHRLIQFSISDTGIGIPADKIDYIFESFSQVNENQGVQSQGVGLGLSIVKNLTHQLGGNIKVESKHKEGSVFTIDIPVEIGRSESEIASNQAQTLPEKLEILLVEDAVFNQIVAVELLKKHAPKAKIELAVNGLEAIEKIKKHDFDLVLMDVRMPVLDGIEATRQIRDMQNDKFKKLLILGLTANAIPQQIELCKTAGMNDVITKPILLHELIDKIVNHLHK